METINKTEQAVFGAGCFWGVEEAFRVMPGVVETEVGYMGGTKEQPTYQEVCTDKTGHAEVVKVVFDPQVISYKDLLEKFWKIHDGTQLNRQGPDVGSQYRSVVFYFDDKQKTEAEHYKKYLDDSGISDKPLATEICKASTFWRAEEYHQKYIMKGGAAACAI